MRDCCCSAVLRLHVILFSSETGIGIAGSLGPFGDGRRRVDRASSELWGRSER